MNLGKILGVIIKVTPVVLDAVKAAPKKRQPSPAKVAVEQAREAGADPTPTCAQRFRA